MSTRARSGRSFACLLAVATTAALAATSAACEDSSTTSADPLRATGAPALLAEPAPATVAAGAVATFSIAATGAGPLLYQWRRNGVALVDGPGVAGATTTSLSLTASAALDATRYSIHVSNALGAVESSEAVLTVTAAPPDGGHGIDGTWTEPVQLNAGDGISAGEPSVAIDAAGNAMAVWRQYTGTPTRNAVWASRYVAGTGWGAAVTFDDGAGNSTRPLVAMTPSGTAVATFVQGSQTEQLYATRFTTTWSGPTNIGANEGAGPDAQRLALAPDGSAIVAFVQPDGTLPRVRITRGSAEGAWAESEMIDGQGSDFPDVAMAPGGHALVTWVQRTSPSTSALWFSRDVGSGWSTPALLAAETGPVSRGIRVVSAGKGNMMAAWSQVIAGQRQVRVARLDDTTGAWGAPVSLSDVTHDAYSEDLAVDSAGNAVLVWFESGSGLRAARFDAATSTWSTASRITDSGASLQIVPRVSVDDGGNAVAVWKSRKVDELVERVYAARLTSAGWGTPVALVRDPAVSAEGAPAVATNARGEVVVVWQQSAPTVAARGIWASMYR